MMNYFQAYSKENLVVGGLDSLGSLSSISSLYLNGSLFNFAENQQLTTSQLTSILTSKDIAKNVLFYNNKTFDDLVFDTLDSGDFVAPSDNFLVTSKDGWQKDAVTSFSWTPVILGNYKVVNSSGKYDFGLAKNVLYTTTDNETLTFNVNVDKLGDHVVWARLLFSPAGGKLTFTIDGNVTEVFNINTVNSILEGFKWVPLGNVSLTPGKHTISIGNENGAFNAVNMVAFPAVSELENHKQNVLDLLNQSNAGIVYFMDNPFLESLIIGGNISVPFFTAKQSSYNINLESNQQLSELNVYVDNKELKVDRNNVFAGDENWYSIGPIDLSQGSHNITLSSGSSAVIEKMIIYSSDSANSSTDSLQKILGGGAESFVASYEKTDPVSFSVVVNASKGFILGFQEPYDELWHSNISSTNLFLNSVNNAFFVDSNSTINTVIQITYSPEQSLQLGLKITLAGFLASLIIICLVLFYPKIRQKSAVQRQFGS